MLVNMPRILAELIFILPGNVSGSKPVRGTPCGKRKICRIKYGLNVMNRMAGSGFKALRRGMTFPITLLF